MSTPRYGARYWDTEEERYPSVGQRCPTCGHHFRVLADEAGTHACPRCGFFHEEEPDERQTDFEDEEGGEA